MPSEHEHYGCDHSFLFETLSVSFITIGLLIFFCGVLLTVYYTKHVFIPQIRSSCDMHASPAMTNAETAGIKILHYSNLCFFLVDLCAILTSLRPFLRICFMPHYAHQVFIQTMCAFVQVFLFVFILFLRLYFIFQNTEFALHKWTVRVFLFLFWMDFMFMLGIGYIYVFVDEFQFSGDGGSHSSLALLFLEQQLSFWLGISVAFLDLVISMWLTYLFISKLYVLVKENSSSEHYGHGVHSYSDALLSLISKCLVLETISGVVFVVVVLWYVLFDNSTDMLDIVINPKVSYFFDGSALLLLHACNFGCVFLGLQFNGKYYRALWLCACLHTRYEHCIAGNLHASNRDVIDTRSTVDVTARYNRVNTFASTAHLQSAVHELSVLSTHAPALLAPETDDVDTTTVDSMTTSTEIVEC